MAKKTLVSGSMLSAARTLCMVILLKRQRLAIVKRTTKLELKSHPNQSYSSRNRVIVCIILYYIYFIIFMIVFILLFSMCILCKIEDC